MNLHWKLNLDWMNFDAIKREHNNNNNTIQSIPVTEQLFFVWATKIN